jgi:hypothetical protein
MESLVHKKETQKHQCDQCDATYLNKNVLKYLMVSMLVLINLFGTFVLNRSNLVNVKIVDRAYNATAQVFTVKRSSSAPLVTGPMLKKMGWVVM